MTRRKSIDTSLWPSLTIEGYLIAPAMLSKISNLHATEQKPENYRIRKGISIKDEISTAFRVGQAHYEEYKKIAKLNSQNNLSFMQGLLKEVFGYDDVETAVWENRLVAGKRVSIDLVSKEENLQNYVTRLSVFNRDTDSSESLIEGPGTYESIWRLVTNGREFCLFRPNESLTRPAYINADLVQMFDNEDIASFSVLWLLTHRTRFGSSADTPSDCILERWRETGTREGEVARDRLAGQVKLALSILGSGFIEANPELACKIQSGEIQMKDWFNELLRLVYRLIFVMVAEDRNLLHPRDAKSKPKRLYAEGYSLSSLRRKCVQSSTWNRHYDCYEVMKIVFKALSGLDGLASIALPALGGLFEQSYLPTIGNVRLQNKVFMEALFKLSWIQSNDSIVPVNWRDIKIEELGSVYESLLDLNPQLGEDRDTLQFAVDKVEVKGSQRKTTGSYYTHESLVQALLKSALDPVLDKTEAEATDKVEALLSLKVIDPACGSGHFLIAAANQIAKRIELVRLQNSESSTNYQETLRSVVRRCIFGVDINPMAIEIVKFVLWIETLTPGLPLGFFDAQIRCGDSLLGVFDHVILEKPIPDIAYKPLTGDSKAVANYYKKENKKSQTGQGEIDLDTGESHLPPPKPDLTALSNVRRMSEKSRSSVYDKADTYRKYRTSLGFKHRKEGADLYIAAFSMPKDGNVPMSQKDRQVPITADVWKALHGVEMSESLRGAVEDVRKQRVFHWSLEFWDVMETGGFDVVLGNPPWERIKLIEEEFFAIDAPGIASASRSSVRKKMISSLEDSVNPFEQQLFERFVIARRLLEAKSTFARLKEEQGGRFNLTGRGDLNTYALFAELFTNLGSSTGRVGIIVPTGIATDKHTSKFFSWLLEKNKLVSLFDLENKKVFFPNIHSSVKFSLLTIGNNVQKSKFSFFIRSFQQLEDQRKFYYLDYGEIQNFNPNTKTSPILRSTLDKELVNNIYANVPILINESEQNLKNFWGVNFDIMFGMSNDSDLFKTSAELAGTGFERDGVNWRKGNESFIPLYEAKMIHQFNHRFGSARTLRKRPASSPWPRAKASELQDTNFEVQPWYFVSIADAAERFEKNQKNYYLVFRSISNATNERTVIATVLHRTAISGKLPAIITDQTAHRDVALVGALNSVVLDYVARSKIGGTDLAFHYVKQLPLLPPEYFCELKLNFIVPKVLELIYTSHSMKPFAQELGYEQEPFIWNELRRANLRSELDAFYAKAYGLSRLQLQYILDPAEVKGSDYPSETFRGLKKNEIKKFGEYRTQRLVLESWDRFESDGTFEKLGV